MPFERADGYDALGRLLGWAMFLEKVEVDDVDKALSAHIAHREPWTKTGDQLRDLVQLAMELVRSKQKNPEETRGIHTWFYKHGRHGTFILLYSLKRMPQPNWLVEPDEWLPLLTPPEVQANGLRTLMLVRARKHIEETVDVSCPYMAAILRSIHPNARLPLSAREHAGLLIVHLHTQRRYGRQHESGQWYLPDCFCCLCMPDPPSYIPPLVWYTIAMARRIAHADLATMQALVHIDISRVFATSAWKVRPV